MGKIIEVYIKMRNGLEQLHIHIVYSSIISINYILYYHTHGKQDLKPQVSGL